MNAVFMNTLRGLARGRMLLVLAALALALMLMQSISLNVERRHLEHERRITEAQPGAEREHYLHEMEKDSAAHLREEALHYCALFIFFASLFVTAAVWGRETVYNGLERLLVSPIGRTQLLFVIIAAVGGCNQMAFSVVFAVLHARLAAAGLPVQGLIGAYAVLTAVHIMLLSVAVLFHTAMARVPAMAATACVSFLGFGAYVIELAAEQLQGPGMSIMVVAYNATIPRVGTLFYWLMGQVRDAGVFPVPDMAWFAAEAVKCAVFLLAAFIIFHRKNY